MDQHFFGQDHRRPVEEEPLLRIIITRLFQHPRKFLIFLSVLMGGGLFFYLTAQKSSAPLSLPLIKAPPGPLRIPSPTENTLLVPHQDRQVYKNIEKISTEAEGPKVEHLLPPVEAPFLSFQEEEEAPGEVAGETREKPVEMTQAPPPKDDLLPTAEKPSPITAREKKEEKRAIDSIDQLLKQTLSPRPQPESSVHKREKYRLQLGSLPTCEAAEQEWERIQKAMKDKAPLLTRLKPRFERIDLGAEKGGIVYRIILGNIGSKEGAKRLESQLKDRKISCLVIAP